MGAPTTRDELRRAIRRGNLLYGAHLVLCAEFVLWRVLETTPALAAGAGATWASAPFGRALTFVCALGGVLALFAAVIATLRAPRDAWGWCLLAALLASLARRETVDVFDLAYVGLALVLATHWYREQRAELRAQALAR